MVSYEVCGGAVGELRSGCRCVSASRGGRDGTVKDAAGEAICYNLPGLLTKRVRMVANGRSASSDWESEGASAEDSV